MDPNLKISGVEKVWHFRWKNQEAMTQGQVFLAFENSLASIHHADKNWSHWSNTRSIPAPAVKDA